MCSLIVFLNAFKGYPFVVAANRDEQFGRPSRTPTFTQGPIKTLAPTDLLRGGTWIKVNERGVFVALTNRRGIASVPGMRSRGELVAAAGDCPTAWHALASVMNRDPAEYNACHMVIYDGKQGFVIVGNGAGGNDVDGHAIEPGFHHAPLQDGVTIVTNLGMGTGTPRGNAIMRAWQQMHESGSPPPPTPGAFTPMLTWHESERPASGGFGRRYGATCLHATDDDPDYGTVSSCVVRLSDTYGQAPKTWQYWHGHRKKCAQALCGVSWGPMLKLDIREG